MDRLKSFTRWITNEGWQQIVAGIILVVGIVGLVLLIGVGKPG